MWRTPLPSLALKVATFSKTPSLSLYDVISSVPKSQEKTYFSLGVNPEKCT